MRSDCKQYFLYVRWNNFYISDCTKRAICVSAKQALVNKRKWIIRKLTFRQLFLFLLAPIKGNWLLLLRWEEIKRDDQIRTTFPGYSLIHAFSFSYIQQRNMKVILIDFLQVKKSKNKWMLYKSLQKETRCEKQLRMYYIYRTFNLSLLYVHRLFNKHLIKLLEDIYYKNLAKKYAGQNI